MLDSVLNFITIFAWAFFAIFIAFLFARALQRGNLRDAIKALITWRVFFALLVTLALTLISASLVFIEPQEVGVVVSLINRDGYREQPLRSGLHWIVPLAEQVTRYPISWQTYTMSTEPYEGAKVGNDTIAARSSDGQQVYLDSSVIFRIDPNEVLRIHIDFQNRYLNDYIRPVLRAVIRSEVSQFTADEINSSKRKVLESDLDEILRQKFSDKGFVLDQFLLRNIAFSPQYTAAIEAKQVAEQKRTEAEYQAEQMRKLAEGTRDRLQIEAAGQANAILQKGQAEADVTVIKAQADAKALDLINQILEKNRDLLLFRYIDKIAPGLRVMLLPSNNPFILSLPGVDQGLNLDTGTPIVPTPEITPTPQATPTFGEAPTATPTASPTTFP